MPERVPTIYVVDDDRSHLVSVERLLRASGYSVRCFSSGEDLLTNLPADAAGCVVADLQMPSMDGIELQTELSESANPLPVVFLTGHGDIPTSVKAMRSGAEDFLTKTAPKAQLLEAIDRAIERDRTMREERRTQSEIESRLERLTAREFQVLLCVLDGCLNKQSAAALGITERSVKRHRTSIMQKLEVDSVAQLTKLAVAAGIQSKAPTRSSPHQPLLEKEHS